MESEEIKETPLKVGEIVQLKAWDNVTRTYVLLMGEITRRIDEPGKLSLYSVRSENVIYHRLRKHLMPKQAELFAG
jgi:hypothetical protein